MQVLRGAGDLPMEQVVAIENALFAGERLAPAIVPIARQALDAWVKEAAPELISLRRRRPAPPEQGWSTGAAGRVRRDRYCRCNYA
jgi:hypothetical protein